MNESTAPAGFRELVLAWLRSEEGGGRLDAVSVENVGGHGSDWSGSTEGGFYSTFSVDINWTDADGKTHVSDPEGEAMDSLWKWVVRSWPEGER